MPSHRFILGIFAHPDDESMGTGATLAKYATMGHRVAFVTATDGGAGRMHEVRPQDEAGRELLKSTRRAETLRAAEILGIESLGFWGWDDGGLAKRNILELEEKIAALIRRERPDVVITVHGSGISYHPDHRIMTMATTSAFLGSAEYLARNRTNPAYVSDLYYGMLRRPADVGGFNYWVGQLNSSAKTREQERQEFLSAPEVVSRINAIATAGCLP